MEASSDTERGREEDGERMRKLKKKPDRVKRCIPFAQHRLTLQIHCFLLTSPILMKVLRCWDLISAVGRRTCKLHRKFVPTKPGTRLLCVRRQSKLPAPSCSLQSFSESKIALHQLIWLIKSCEGS